MRVLLCYPSLLPGQKPKYGLQPLGVLYIAALLKQHGIEVKVLDADVDGLTVEEIVDRILEWNPDLVGFSMMTPQLMTGLEASSLIKQMRPDIRIVLGGAHIDSTHEDVFSMDDCFDFAIYGEGEFPLLEIVQNMEKNGTEDLEKSLQDATNVIYRNAAGEIVKKASRPFVMDLDVFPRVDYDMLDVSKYSIPTMRGKYVISMMLSRGCPFRCTFCDAPQVMGKKFRYFSQERIMEDIQYYKAKYDCDNFVFKDSTFTPNKKWVDELMDRFLDAGLNIKWRCNTRVHLVPHPLLTKMHQAGCYVINFGVESGDPQILKNIKKEVKIEDIYDAHHRCRKLGIRTYATFLMGNPGETDETAQRTIDVACGIRPNLAMFFVSTAYPGTPMYEDAVKNGYVQERWWASPYWESKKSSAFELRWGWTSKGGLKIPGFDSEKWQKKATRAFYFRPYFVWDTIMFTLKNPYFFRHLWNLGKEILPIYKIPMPWRKSKVNELHRKYERCPSAPTQDYESRAAVASK
jgi:radical SAM superfamily enzyme YgiQ (UPF0313 family)